MAARASAMERTTAPAMVTGAMAPASVKGVTMTGWPRRAKRMAPSSMGESCFRGDEELMLVKRRGWLSNSAWGRPEAMRAISITSSTRSAPRL